LPFSPAAEGKVINLGSDVEISIAELAQLVKDTCKSHSEIVLVPYDKAYGPGFDDMARRIPDTSRARELLDWRPEGSLATAIEQIAVELRN
jgi:UDP-glucose 4-epimerase